MESLAITPYRSYGSLRLGMTEDQMLDVFDGQRSYTSTSYMLKGITQTVYRFDGFGCVFSDSSLACISIKPNPHITLGGEAVPFAQMELLPFLKKRSEYRLSFPYQQGYVFYDLGLVLYLYKTTDILAGKRLLSSSTRIALSDKTTIRQYLKHFIGNEADRGGKPSIDETISRRIGIQLERWTEMPEAELDEYLNTVDESIFKDEFRADDLGYIVNGSDNLE